MDATEMSFVFTAVLFTLLAIIVANTIFRKTASEDECATTEKQNEKSDPEVEINEFSAGHRTEDEKSAEGLKIIEAKTIERDDPVVEKGAPVPVASELEDIGVVEKQAKAECVNTKESSPKPVSEDCVPESVPGPQVPNSKTVNSKPVQHTGSPKPTDANETTSNLEWGVVPCPTLQRGPSQMHVPVPDPELVPEMDIGLGMQEEELEQYSPVNEEDDVAAGVEIEEDLPLKYTLGKLRVSQLEEMMTKEELEEEQRIEFTTDFTSL